MQWWKKQESPCFSCGECQKGQNLTFLYTNGKKAMTDLQDSSNIMMKATMKVANDYLKKNLNLTMKDLGFTAYK